MQICATSQQADAGCFPTAAARATMIGSSCASKAKGAPGEPRTPLKNQNRCEFGDRCGIWLIQKPVQW